MFSIAGTTTRDALPLLTAFVHPFRTRESRRNRNPAMDGGHLRLRLPQYGTRCNRRASIAAENVRLCATARLLMTQGMTGIRPFETPRLGIKRLIFTPR